MTPVSAWSKLPEGLTDTEAKLIEIKTRLDLLDATAATGIQFPNDGDRLGGGLKRVKTGDFLGAIGEALKPSIASAEEIGGFRDRNELRKQLNEQLLYYEAQRAKDHPMRGSDPSASR